jgi:type VI secretion system protein ImpA
MAAQQMNTTTITLAPFQAPVSDDAPSGPNLEYDARFLSLEAALRGTAEVEYGSTLTPATPPDWQVVNTLALALITETRDLRIAVALARAGLALHGVAGLAEGLSLLAWLLAQQWDTVHPQLESEDDFDPMLRINVLAALVEPSQLLRELRAAALVQVRALGSFSLRDIDGGREQVRSEEGAEDGSKAIAVIDAAFAAADPEALAATLAALQAARDSMHVIEEQLALRVGASQSLDLAPLAVLITQALAVVRDHVRAASPEAAGDDPVTEGAAGDAPRARASDTAYGSIRSRADVVAMLDRLCTYYAQHEPASPIPLLLQRARRLVDKSFVELLEDLAPDGLAQLARASGIPHESS